MNSINHIKENIYKHETSGELKQKTTQSKTEKISFHFFSRISSNASTAAKFVFSLVSETVKCPFIATYTISNYIISKIKYVFFKSIGIHHSNPTSRDYRVILDSGKIQHSLEKQLKRATNQQNQQLNTAKKLFTLPSRESKILDEFHTTCCEDNDVYAAVTHAKGKRPTQEDEDICSVFFISDKEFRAHKILLNGIFDGHGGGEASKYLKDNLQNRLENNFKKFSLGILTNALSALNTETELNDVVIWNILKITCVELSEEIKAFTNSGSTGSFSLLIDGNLWTANVGDSRTLLVGKDVTLQLSEDAKPEFNFPLQLSQEQFEDYETRHLHDKAVFNRSIWKRNGFVRRNRVNSNLAVARAFGDRLVTGVTARPKITKINLKELYESTQCNKWILVNGCDGVFDVLNSHEVGEAITSNTQESLEILTEKIVHTAILNGSTDNVSISLVHLPTTF